MSYEKLIGEQFTTKHSGMCTVKSVENFKKITVQFEDGFETTCTLQHLKEGSVLNPYHPKIYGAGNMCLPPQRVKLYYRRTLVR